MTKLKLLTDGFYGFNKLNKDIILEGEPWYMRTSELGGYDITVAELRKAGYDGDIDVDSTTLFFDDSEVEVVDEAT